MTLQDARLGLAEALKTLGIQVYDVWPPKAIFPCAVIRRGAGNYAITQQIADADFTFTIVIAASPGRGTYEGAQYLLEEYADTEGEKSINQLFCGEDADCTLGGRVAYVMLQDVDTPAVEKIGDVECWTQGISLLVGI